MKKRILMTASTFPRYQGDTCPRFILDFCIALSDTNEIECLVLAPHSEKSALFEQIEGINVKRYKYFFPDSLEKISGNGIVPFLKKNPLFFFVIPFFLFFQLIYTFITIKNYKPDIIIANWIFPQGFIAALIKLVMPDLKIIMVSHGGDAALIKNNFFIKKLARFTIQRATKLVAVSTFLKNILQAELKIKNESFISIISMAVDEKLFKTNCNTPKTEKNILFVGRLVEKKGVKYLIDSMQTVVKKHPDVILNIIGDGPIKNELVNQTKLLNLQNNIIFHGGIKHSRLPVFFDNALIFAAPSINLNDDFEGMPTVLTEAVASKVPVITTDAGGITDLIKNDETGIIVEQKNSTQLAQSLIQLLENENTRNTLAENAYQKLLEDFTYEKIAQKYKELFKEFN